MYNGWVTLILRKEKNDYLSSLFSGMYSNESSSVSLALLIPRWVSKDVTPMEINLDDF